MEVFSPGTKNLQNHLLNRMLVYVYREFRLRERPGVLSQIRADEIPIEHPLTDVIMRKGLKHCADLEVDLSPMFITSAAVSVISFCFPAMDFCFS